MLSPTTIASQNLSQRKQNRRGINLWKKLDPEPVNTSTISVPHNHHHNTEEATLNLKDISNAFEKKISFAKSPSADSSSSEGSDDAQPVDNISNLDYQPFGTPPPLTSSEKNTNRVSRSFSFHQKVSAKQGQTPEVVFVPHTVENSHHCFHTSEEKEMMSFEMYDQLLQNNIDFVREKIKQDPQFFKKHKENQKPNFLLIGCSDSRVSTESIIKISPGQMFIHRNIGNMVVNTDLNLMSVLQYAVEVLNVKHVIVMGHTRCGGVKAALGNSSNGLIDKWLRNIKDVYRLHKAEVDAIEDADAQ